MIAPTPAQPVTTHALASQAPSSSRPAATPAPGRAAPRHLLRRRLTPRQRTGRAGQTERISFRRWLERGSTDIRRAVEWIETGGRRDGSGGFDGQALTDIGLTNGSLTIDDRRNDHQWKLTQITLNLSRPRAGGAVLAVLSEIRNGRGR